MVNRKKPMKILVAGMPRTGTVSITSALKELGFTPYDYFTRLEEGHLAHWNAMLKAKCRGQLRGLDKDSVDRLTGDFDCISDAPCFFLVEDLAKAFPNAKILLNEREVEAWLSSIKRTLQPSFEADQSWYYRAARWLDPTLTRPIMDCDALTAAVLCDRDYTNNPKLEERFFEHYKSLSQLLASHQVLRYRTQEGWEPLCQFLNLPTPNSPFPRKNDTKHLQDLSRQAARQSLHNSVRNLFAGAMVVLMVLMAFGR